MKIDNVYITLIKVIVSGEQKDYMTTSFRLKSLKFALVYLKKNCLDEYEYLDLETKQKYKTSKDYIDIGDLILDLDKMIPYRQFLYQEQQKNPNLKIKNNMFKRKMLTLFNEVQNGGNKWKKYLN